MEDTTAGLGKLTYFSSPLPLKFGRLITKADNSTGRRSRTPNDPRWKRATPREWRKGEVSGLTLRPASISTFRSLPSYPRPVTARRLHLITLLYGIKPTQGLLEHYYPFPLKNDDSTLPPIISPRRSTDTRRGS